MEEQTINLKMHELPQVILMEAQLPMPMVDDLTHILTTLWWQKIGKIILKI